MLFKTIFLLEVPCSLSYIYKYIMYNVCFKEKDYPFSLYKNNSWNIFKNIQKWSKLFKKAPKLTWVYVIPFWNESTARSRCCSSVQRCKETWLYFFEHPLYIAKSQWLNRKRQTNASTEGTGGRRHWSYIRSSLQYYYIGFPTV